MRSRARRVRASVRALPIGIASGGGERESLVAAERRRKNLGAREAPFPGWPSTQPPHSTVASRRPDLPFHAAPGTHRRSLRTPPRQGVTMVRALPRVDARIAPSRPLAGAPRGENISFGVSLARVAQRASRSAPPEARACGPPRPILDGFDRVDARATTRGPRRDPPRGGRAVQGDASPRVRRAPARAIGLRPAKPAPEPLFSIRRRSLTPHHLRPHRAGFQVLGRRRQLRVRLGLQLQLRIQLRIRILQLQLLQLLLLRLRCGTVQVPPGRILGLLLRRRRPRRSLGQG